MKSAEKHPLEKQRLEALERLKILDTEAEKDFDDLVYLASQICDTPIALISLVDESRQWFKSKKGLNESETARDVSFCAHAILEPDTFIVSNAKEDSRFKDNPLVTGEPRVVFYAGEILLSPDGFPIGTLCVIDHKSKVLTKNQKVALKALSVQINRLLELRSQVSKQKELVRTLEFKETAIMNLTEGVVLQDCKYKIIEFNPAALSVLGLTIDQLTGKTSLDPNWRCIREDGTAFPGDQHPAVVAMSTGIKQESVMMGVYRPNLELRWIEINSSPILNKVSGQPEFVVSSFTDVTLIREANLALKRGEAHLKQLLNSIPAMVAHWDKNLINLLANDAHKFFFGRTPEEIKGKSLMSLLSKEIIDADFAFIQKVLKGEPQIFERTQGKQGETLRHLLINYIPDFEGNEVVGFFVIATDVTEIKKLESERQLLAAKMIESAKLSTLGEMAGGVAHEINTPLAIINTKASMLLESYGKGEANEAETIKQLEKIKITVERIAKIVKGLRQFSRNSISDPMESIAVGSIIDSTLDLCKEKILNSQIELIIKNKGPVLVAGKFTELSQVFMNLIGNSVDAVAGLSKKWITIEYKQMEKSCILYFTDSGEGIKPEVASKMMNPFFSTKEVGKGTGLGLSISMGIIESHGGRLFYEKRNGNTCFVVEIPLASLSSVSESE